MSVSRVDIASVAEPRPVSTAPPASAVRGAGASGAVTQISKGSELMSKLGQLAADNPAKFKAVTKAIANNLGPSASARDGEIAKRAALEAELARLQQSQTSTSSQAQTEPTAPTAGRGRDALASAFSAAATAGNLAPVTSSASASWTEPALAAALTESLTLVNEALGLTG